MSTYFVNTPRDHGRNRTVVDTSGAYDFRTEERQMRRMTMLRVKGLVLVLFSVPAIACASLVLLHWAWSGLQAGEVVIPRGRFGSAAMLVTSAGPLAWMFYLSCIVAILLGVVLLWVALAVAYKLALRPGRLDALEAAGRTRVYGRSPTVPTWLAWVVIGAVLFALAYGFTKHL